MLQSLATTHGLEVIVVDDQSHAQHIKETLESFLEMFNEYAKEVYGDQRRDRLDELRTKLQQQAPKVTSCFLEILGDAAFAFGPDWQRSMLSRRDLLSASLLGGNNELPHNFRNYEALVTSALNKAIGTIKAGLWPPKEPTPVLVIKDDELRSRCSDLLKAPGNYDRVIREATTVLENRLRNKPSHELLARLIPNAADQTGDNLVNKLLSPKNPTLVISSEKQKQLAFYRIMLGVVSYLRNPYHHNLDPYTEWSWAWSTVGFIDRLLSDIEICVVPK